MAILPTDFELRLSGGAGNTAPASAIGGAMSTAGGGEITTAGDLNNLFDDVSDAEALAGDTEYRCVYIKNAHATLTAQSVLVYLASLTTSPSTEYAIGAATEGPNATVAAVANEGTAPAGVTFSSPTTSGAAVALGDLDPGEYHGFWIRRTVNAATNSGSDSGTLRIQALTAP